MTGRLHGLDGVTGRLHGLDGVTGRLHGLDGVTGRLHGLDGVTGGEGATPGDGKGKMRFGEGVECDSYREGGVWRLPGGVCL